MALKSHVNSWDYVIFIIDKIKQIKCSLIMIINISNPKNSCAHPDMVSHPWDSSPVFQEGFEEGYFTEPDRSHMNSWDYLYL